ncbi:MAG: WD40 repeat domain-containing protein [Terriglobia bacterium]
MRPSRKFITQARVPIVLSAIGVLTLVMTGPRAAQLETIPGPSPPFVWEHRVRVEGHLALTYSPDGAFSPDGATLAIAEPERIALVSLADGRVQSVVRPQFPAVSSLSIQSANFVGPARLFILASGVLEAARHHPAAAPELAFQWDLQQGAVAGKVSELGVGGGFLPPRYFPRIGYVALYKDGAFTVWNPVTGRAGSFKIPQLTHAPHLYAFSPDGHWLLLAQIEMNATPDPVVVELQTHQFVNTLAGHHGPVLGMAFSRDGKSVVTACADGNVRIYSVPDWKLIETLTGNTGPVHWAEFSPDGNWVASAGEDATVRIWSAATGKLAQTLTESRHPLLTVAFSPNGQYVAASSADGVHVWARTAE